MGPYGSIWALMGPRCAHVGPFRPKGFCINHLQVFVKRRGSHWQPVGTLCRCLVFFLTLEAIIHPKWQKSETNFKNYPDFCDWQLISLVRIPVVSLWKYTALWKHMITNVSELFVLRDMQDRAKCWQLDYVIIFFGILGDYLRSCGGFDSDADIYIYIYIDFPFISC